MDDQTLTNNNPINPPTDLGGADIQSTIDAALSDPVEKVTAPLPIPEPSAPSEPMTEDLPLAFVTPPVEVPPASPTIPVEPMKKKSKLGVILVGIVGLFLVLGGSVFGYLYYTKNLPPSKSIIANIQTKYPDPGSCNGACDNGRLLKWNYGQDRCVDSGKPCNWEGQEAHSKVVACSTPGSVQCDGCGGFCITPIKETCNQMQVIKCGEAPVTGAACMSVAPETEADKKRFFYPCDCGGTNYWFDAQGTCGNKDDGYSLCAVTKYATCVNDAGETGTGSTACDYTCNNNGCTCNSGSCQVYHWKCDKVTNLGGGCQDGTPKIGQSASFSASCGSEQIDVVCNGKDVDFRSRTNTTVCEAPSKPPTIIPSPSPSGSVAPTMSCTGLTKNVASPVVGSKITFTCAGATVPAGGASLLKYDFRYSLNDGAWTPLTNKTSATTELTIVACGSYAVQCRACGTMGATTICDPIWTGATQ